MDPVVAGVDRCRGTIQSSLGLTGEVVIKSYQQFLAAALTLSTIIAAILQRRSRKLLVPSQ